MKAWLQKNHVLMKLLSVFLSILLWLYVIYQDNPERTVTFSDLSVRLLNTEYLKRYNGLMVTNADTIRVTVQLSGAFNKLENVTQDDIRVTADVSKLTEAGTYTLSYDISALDGVTVVQRSRDIEVEVEKLETVELPVDVSVSGSLPDGLVADTAIAEPATVTLTGLKKDLENADCVQVLVNGEDLTQDYEADCAFELLDRNGKSMDVSAIDFDRKRVHVEIPVYREKTVPVEVNMVYGKGATEENTVVTLSKDSIKVVGDIEAVDALESVQLTTIDTATFTQESHQEYTIHLPEGVWLDEEEEKIKVDVSFTNLETRQIVINDIRLENTSPNYQTTVESKQVLVSLRGTKEMLDSLTAGDVVVVVNLSGITVIEGMQNIPAQIVLSDRVSEMGVFGEYAVMIRSVHLADES